MVNFNCLMEKPFGEWLLETISERGLSQIELSRRTGISSGHITRIINGERGVGEKSMYLISRALQIPPEELYRKYGLLPPKPKDSVEFEELLFLWSQLNPLDRQEMKEFIKIKLEHKRAAIKKSPALSVLKEKIEQ